LVEASEALDHRALSEMARNEEKALTLFSKWSTFKTDYHSGKACAEEMSITYESTNIFTRYKVVVQLIGSMQLESPDFCYFVTVVINTLSFYVADKKP
jgi:hypothetical protein